MPRVLALNVGTLRHVEHAGESVPTGIFKSAVSGSVQLSSTGFEGDQQGDLVNHGGRDKAVYAYPWEHYAHWRHVLGQEDLPTGQLGENLTTAGLSEREVLIGETFEVGSALIQASQARIPCFKLDIRVGRPGFVGTFLRAELPGIYFRVLRPGEVKAGDTLTSIDRPIGSVTVWEANHTLHFDRHNQAMVKRVLASKGLAESWRKKFETLLPTPRRYVVLESPAGPLTVAINRDGKLTHLLFGEHVQNGWVRDEAALDHVRTQVGEYFAGVRKTFDIEIAPEGTEFQLRVWDALRRIPYGQTRCYSDIANEIGRPDSVRAVGGANGANPIAIVIPCHRVIGKDGSLTGFGGGVDVKYRLLALEQGQLRSLFDE